ncbi:hypothetical protein CROQUDRAFT_95280 [Cronartium quercuum f. sp. fusiforme G11]|uniref:Uncharacterized protein n=1 Tax=Cronartium quercuum f. sp. fusiforme G11 TaxID=708437 RepID=A0A9P6NCP5_9BASI|nr:hypothetical protein CROQUDRAFT_95280 [Cronartium quercuum f. sp. fusiforme G11]
MDSDLNSASPPSSPPTISDILPPSSSITKNSPSPLIRSESTINTLNPNTPVGTASSSNVFGFHTMATSMNPASSNQAQGPITQVSIPPTTLAMIPKLSTGNFHAWKM